MSRHIAESSDTDWLKISKGETPVKLIKTGCLIENKPSHWTKMLLIAALLNTDRAIMTRPRKNMHFCLRRLPSVRPSFLPYLPSVCPSARPSVRVYGKSAC